MSAVRYLHLYHFYIIIIKNSKYLEFDLSQWSLNLPKNIIEITYRNDYTSKPVLSNLNLRIFYYPFLPHGTIILRKMEI